MKHFTSTFVAVILWISFAIICKAKSAQNTQPKRGSVRALKRGEIINEDEKHGQISRNKGSPLDGDNAHEDVRNKGKPPEKQSEKTLSKTGRLVNRFHWMIQISGLKVSGTRDSDSPAGKMNVTTVGKDLVEIKGIKADSFLCMNSQSGDIYVSKFSTKNCIFKEHLEENFHSTFRLNIPDASWYLGIDKDGKFLIKNTLKPDFATLFQIIS